VNAQAPVREPTGIRLRAAGLACWIALAAWMLGAWYAIADWADPAEAVNNLSDWQFQVLCAVARIAAVLLLAAIALLWVFHEVQTAMPIPGTTP
jgi:hypothetical protein